MAESNDLIKIISSSQMVTGATSELEYLPKEGEKAAVQQHMRFLPSFVSKKSAEMVAKDVEDISAKVSEMVVRVASKISAAVKLDEVKVGLAVSGEGDVGFASAGMEVSIELTFKINH